MEKIDLINLQDGEDFASVEGVEYIDGKKKNASVYDRDLEEWKENRRFCEGCKYRSLNDRACDYYFLTGERRGCKAGEGCTRREDGKRDPQCIVLRGKLKL